MNNHVKLKELDEKWKQHFTIVKLSEQGIKIEDIAKMEGLSEDVVRESFTDSRTQTYFLFFYKRHTALHMCFDRMMILKRVNSILRNGVPPKFKRA